MKQHHLSTKFLRFYILIGILGFFLITLGGSYMVEKHLEHSLSAALYTEAHNIASNEAVKSNISSSTVDTLQEHLCAISDFQDAVLWIINSNGEIIVSTQKNIDVRDPIPLEEFDASKWGSNYYQIGKFYGFFKTDHLSVIAPITSDMETKGYVAIHYSMTNLYQSRSSILFIMQVIFLLCYAATSLLLWAYSHYIRKPLARIMKGASEYAGGNLAYKIDVTSDDEMGYLAKTLNYMSDELNKNGEYQRKFIANVSHDFRSPLTSIKGYVNAILDGTIPYEMQERYLKIIAFESFDEPQESGACVGQSGQDADDQFLPHQRCFSHCRFTGLRLCQALEERDRELGRDDGSVFPEPAGAQKSGAAGGYPPCTFETGCGNVSVSASFRTRWNRCSDQSR